MRNFEETKFFDGNLYGKEDIYNILKEVITIIEEKGYSPINQLMGYIKTGDPVFIPRDNHCREKMRMIEIDDILEFLLYFFTQES